MLTLQSQETALRPAAINALEDLKKSTAQNEKLQRRLVKAMELITETSAQINDRAAEERTRYNKRLNKLIASGNSEDAEDKEENEEFQNRVEVLTKKMDMNIRRMIDDEIWIEEAPLAIEHVRSKATNTSNRQRSTQATSQYTQDSTETSNQPEPSESQLLTRPDPSDAPTALLDAPTALLDAALSTANTRWQARSLTDRYSENNRYVGWYRMVYDAKHPGENAPPMPHASVWFAQEENRSTTTVPQGSQGRRQRSRPNARSTRTEANSQSDSESDVEIAAERVRIRCPITLLPYKDPMASTKCPHAFEKSAIREMFRHTSEHLPFTAEQLSQLSQVQRSQERSKMERQMKVPTIRCPECSIPLTEKDLRPDPVLLRKVNRIMDRERRMEEAEQRQDDEIVDAEDDEEDDDGPPRGTQRRNILHIGSSPARSVRRQSGRIVKNERASIAHEIDIDDD